jgi:biopolymer transport protein ExbD
MPKIHIKKGSVSLDMTAMCDVAFLLLTFFVLTAKAKPQEPVEVMTPSSIVELPVPDINIITILIDKPGRVFIGMDNADNSRALWLDGMTSQFNLKLDAKSKSDFINGGVLPVGIKDLPKYLSSDATTKKDLVTKTEGIAVDTSNAPSNELKDWIMNARRANSKASVVVKADAKAPYAVIRKVMKTLQNQGVDRFSLLTTMGAKD